MPKSSEPESIAQTRARLKKVVATLEATFPDARLELDFSTPLELLVALILAAQSRDVLVNQLTPPLFRRYPDAAAYAAAELADLESAVRALNMGRKKAAGIRDTCRALVERFGGNVPRKLDDLLSLPRVGRKTANVLLGNAFGHDALGVDTHVARLSQRLGLTTATDPEAIEAALMDLVPKGRRVRFTHLMQFHGRRICVTKKPKCPECTVNKLCPYPLKTPPDVKRPRGAKKIRESGRATR
jgi:endonuclease-3